MARYSRYRPSSCYDLTCQPITRTTIGAHTTICRDHMFLRRALSLITLATVATLVVGGCSGSSSSTDTPAPPAPTGKIDVSYGVAGKATLGSTFGATVDNAG